MCPVLDELFSFTEVIKSPVCTETMLDATVSSKCVGRFFRAAALVVFVIYTRRIKSPVQNYNSTMVMILTLIIRCFSPSAAVHQPSYWSMLVMWLFSALGTITHVCIACKCLHAVMKMCLPLQQQLRSLSVTVLFLWLMSNAAFPNINLKHRPKIIHVEDRDGSMLNSWAIFEHIQLLVSLFCVFIFFPFLLQYILTKLNYLCVLLHLQLVICQQNSRIPTQYVLVIKINRLI